MAGPFAPGKITVIAGGHNMTPPDVSLIDPILVEQNLIFPPAPKAAVQHMVTAIQGLPNSLANDGAAGSELFAEHAETADLSLRSELMDDPGYGSAVAEKVAAFA